jgi:predicted MFS family arabinose efflux permease
MVADVYPSDDGLGTAIGLVLGAHTVGNFVGPILGGFMGELYGLKYPFFLCIFLALFDCVGRLVIKPTISSARAPSEGEKEQVKILTLLANKNVLLTLYGIIIVSSTFSCIELFTASWLINDWGFTESKVSLYMLGFILPNMVMSATTGWLSDRYPRHLLIGLGLFLHSLAVPLIPLAQNRVQLVLFFIMFGATAPMISSPSSPHLAAVLERLGGSSYAQLYALFNMTWSVGMLVGPFVVNKVKERYGFFMGMATLAIFSLIHSPICIIFNSVPPPGRNNRIAIPDSVRNESSTTVDKLVP